MSQLRNDLKLIKEISFIICFLVAHLTSPQVCNVNSGELTKFRHAAGLEGSNNPDAEWVTKQKGRRDPLCQNHVRQFYVGVIMVKSQLNDWVYCKNKCVARLALNLGCQSSLAEQQVI